MENEELFRFIPPPEGEEFICDICETYPKRVLVSVAFPRDGGEPLYLCEKHMKDLRDFLNKNL